MGFCGNCGQQILPNAAFCVHCGFRITNGSLGIQIPENQTSEVNTLMVLGGMLTFDENDFRFNRDTNQAAHDLPGIFKFAAQLNNSIVGNMSTTQSIPLGLIDSVQLTWVEGGLISKVPVAGDLMAQVAGGIRIFSASGGPRSEQGFFFVKGQEENAKAFVATLKSATVNRGRKVEMVSGSAPEQTKTCPDCAEDVKAAANICRFCGHKF